jgi:hypothetical protein
MRLQEQLKEIKRLMTEATASSSSGSYEVPMGFDEPVETGELIGTEIMDDAPEVTVVDITASDDVETCPTCGEAECPGHDDEYTDEEDVDLTDVFNALGLFSETTLKEDEMDTLEKEQSDDSRIHDDLNAQIDKLEKEQSDDSRIHTDLNTRIDDLESRVSKLEKN